MLFVKICLDIIYSSE